MLVPRYLEGFISQDLESKMVLVAGARQVGKTTLAKGILQKEAAGLYLSWDNRADREEIRSARWPGGEALVVLDELHKHRFWKRWLKGEFDKHRDRLRFLVTGSARLDVYRKGGDSLQRRYHHYRLHPLSCAEIQSGARPALPVPGAELSVPRKASRETVDALLRYGGFPEPFLAQSERVLRRWQKERLERFFREDVRDLEAVRDLSDMQLMADMLVDRVASPLSMNALREDLEVSHKAVSHWMTILERLYYAFRIKPHAAQTVRGLRKMPKAYLGDWSLVPEPGPRFENLVASHLLKFCHLLEDAEGYRVSLHYLRDRAGREVDFLVTLDRKPWFAVEAKIRAQDIDPSLRYYREKLRIPWAYQVVLEGDRDFVEKGVRCLPASAFLAALV
ncbi:MAG: ATP-binding protein [Planctomycetes bacterium]|nr:ATP-binding protein [Planctomycetota bacterium]